MACPQSSCSLDASAVGGGGLRPDFTFGASPVKMELYQQLSEYYSNPFMTKVDFSHPHYSMYVVRINTMLGENRYLIAICPLDRNPVGTQTRLAFLRWVSFQARASKTVYRCGSHSYHPAPNPVSNSSLVQISSTAEKSVYHSAHYPLVVELLGDKNFHTTGTMGECLESFSTVLTQN